MSVHISSDVWRHSKAKGAALLVLLSLADQANDDGQCFPKIEQIAQRCRVSRASVFRYLQTLRELGELTWEERHAEGRPNLYTLTVTPSQSETPPRLNGETTPVSTVRPQEPSLEPSKEPPTPEPTPDLFAAFYDAYPRHDGRAAAERKFASLTSKRGGIDPAVIIEGARLFRKVCERDGTPRKYIAMPASWLNAGRWEDESLTLPADEPRTEGFGW